jgi:hypothetical protein
MYVYFSVFPWCILIKDMFLHKHIETINGDDPRTENKNRGYFPHIAENL